MCLLVCNFSGKFSHISGLRADGFPYGRLVIISTAPNFSIHRRCKLRNSGESEGFSYRSARVTKRSDKLTTLTTNQRKLGSNTSVLRTNRILRFEMMNAVDRITIHNISIHNKRIRSGGIDLDEGC